MPIHDWSRVEAGIFHHFHHSWIEEVARSLNENLPGDYYALAEQYASSYGPDVLTLKGSNGKSKLREPSIQLSPTGDGDTAVLAPPAISVTAETDMEFYTRKQKVIAVRHVSDDEVVAVVEVVSRANKSSQSGIEQFTQKAAWLLKNQVHLLILDLQPTTPRDPNGIHGYLWQYISGDESYQAPSNKPLTLVAYEAGAGIRAFVVPVAVGDTLPDMPVFLQVDAQIPVPLEETYQRALEAMPRRWRAVLEQAD